MVLGTHIGTNVMFVHERNINSNFAVIQWRFSFLCLECQQLQSIKTSFIIWLTADCHLCNFKSSDYSLETVF